MHRKAGTLKELLPPWFTCVLLSIPFTVLILAVTQEHAPGIFLSIVQKAVAQDAMPVDVHFVVVLMLAFLLYVLLACIAGLVIGMLLNVVLRFIWRLAEH
ncbi:hypothetical protein [Pantoea cypripedii]|uniref:Uncharacterized protein n=1 Tax=Pantoea cypripedii TaxID=55209 RepID=A0A1X1EMD8_PANCY|nr:hypothetical protein [Pantoea cypripedii]MBP2200599.1 hypothetical protein [Pantoea cypripedii]ORM90095.1 hypothetical protein HA50_26350 [Pantoea cypripedii]